jgi:hypothetical protein
MRGFRFRRFVRVLPGVSLKIRKTGDSSIVGGPGTDARKMVPPPAAAPSDAVVRPGGSSWSAWLWLVAVLVLAAALLTSMLS